MPIIMMEEPAVKLNKSELREKMDPIAYQVTQEKGTER